VMLGFRTVGSIPAYLAAGAVLLGALCRSGNASPVPHPGVGAVQLQHIALQSGPGSAVLTLSLTGPVAQHVFRLHDPERVVIDLPDTRRVASLPSPPAGSVVTAMRSGPQAQHGLRLVLDLSSPMHWQQQQAAQSGGWHLRIALQSPVAPAPGAALPRPPTPAQSASPVQPAQREGAAPDLSVRAAHAPSGSERAVVIAVDAGHGGDDPGATGQSGTHEKDVTLAIARSLAARINREPGMRAVLTRDGDYFVDLLERRERASAAHADMFVSIHADAIRDRSVSGASVYVLSERGASSQAAKILAEQQNAADLKGGISLAEQKPELRSILLNLAQSENIGGSSEAADRVLTALDGVGAVRKHEVQQAAFVVLKSPDIPSMLVETAYISNPAEERSLRNPAQQQRLAEAIFSGIGSYFRKFPPEGSLFAHVHEPGSAATEALARSRS
jgi:N-acetylmuramoyl-L-alanine amidase